MGIGIKDFLVTELLSCNGEDVDNDAAKASVEDGPKLTSSSVGERGGGQPTEHDSERPKPNYSALNFLAIPAPNKWRGSKIKIHDKDVIQAQEQERSTQNLRKARSKRDGIRSKKEQVTEGSSSNAQADKQGTIPTGNGAGGRRIYTTRNGLMSYGLGRSGLKRGKKKNSNAGGPTGPVTPPRPAKSQKSPPKSPPTKSRVHGPPKKKSPTAVRKRKKLEVDPEEEGGNWPKRRSLQGASEHPEEKGRTKKRSD